MCYEFAKKSGLKVDLKYEAKKENIEQLQQDTKEVNNRLVLMSSKKGIPRSEINELM